MRSRKWSLAVAVLVLAGAAGCTNGDASGGQAAAALENSDAVSGEQARCVGNRLEPAENGLTQEELNRIADEDDLTELAGIDMANSDQDLLEFTRGVLSDCLGGRDGADDGGDSETDAESESGDAESDGDTSGG